jgi:hypothetical protein
MSATFDFGGTTLRYDQLTDDQHRLFSMLATIDKKLPDMQAEIAIMEAARDNVVEAIGRSLEK